VFMKKAWFTLYLLLQSLLWGTWFEKMPETLTQPDGGIIECFVTGDQFYHRLHDEKGFTIVLNPKDGYFVYAQKNGDKIVPSEYRVHDVNPVDVGLSPNLLLSESKYKERRNQFAQDIARTDRDAPTSGSIEQINVFIKFADDPDFPNPRIFYDEPFSLEDEPSLRNYYQEVSYETLDVQTHHFPEWTLGNNTAYIDIHNRNYYQPYSGANPEGYENNDQRTEREHTLLKNAIESIEMQVPADLIIDANNDGYVDAISFVIYGETDGWAELLWPHRWSLYSEPVYIHGVRAWDYLFMLSESSYFNVGVLCHEFFHVLGAPDLYHYSDTGAPSPVGGWDVMEANSNPPQYMSAFMKYKYGDWLTYIPEITESGTYTLNPLQMPENVIYKVASPNSDTEYYVLEYRKKEGLYEINTPGNRSGLVIYRINTEAENGNASGPPDEIYVYRPGGTISSNGNFDSAPYSSNYNHTAINDDTNPAPFLYDGGSGGAGGLNIYNVAEAGETISFFVALGNAHLSVFPEIYEDSLEINHSSVESFTLSNDGEVGSVINYTANVSSLLLFENPSFGPDEGNYFVAFSTEETNLDYDWIDISSISTDLIFSHNDVSADTIDLDFSFPFFDEMFTHCIVNPNGWIGFGADNSEWSNFEIPSQEAARPAIFAFWDDLNPNNLAGAGSPSGDVRYHANEERLVVWFDQVVRWTTSSSGTFDFQIILYADGQFRVNYREMSGTINTATIGFQDRTGTLGTQIFINENLPQNQNFSWMIDRPIDVPWLSINGNLSGSLTSGESETIYATIDTDSLELGFYEASVNVLSEGTNSVLVPVYLTIIEPLATDESLILPEETRLHSAYPNPFNPSTTFRYSLAEKTHVSLIVYDLLGHPVRTLVNQVNPVGEYQLQWNGKNDQGQVIGAGIYFYQMMAQRLIKTHKIILLK